MKVPFLDLKAQYNSIKEEIDTAISNVLENTAFVLGKYVQDFEKNFAEYVGVKHAIGVNSGTAALHVSLLALEIGKGDEVITVPNTFFATAEAISLTGATPVFVDVDESTFNMNPDLLGKAITDKTKAIIPVHLYGQPVDLDKIQEIADKHNLIVIEDAAQAIAAEFNNKKIGSFGKTACFSFYPGKNLGAYGEAGMITTNDDKLAQLSKLYRAHGEYPKNHHSVVGLNYRMTGFQGAILDVKLTYIDEWTKKRQEAAKYYDEILQHKDIILPQLGGNRTHVYHLYVIRVKDRDKLRDFLASKDIGTGIHYLMPIHLQEVYADLGFKEGMFPVSEKVMSEIVSLPIFPELTREQQDYVAEMIKEFLDN